MGHCRGGNASFFCFMANYLAVSEKSANFAVGKQSVMRKLTDIR
jgi:hypothetical protein